MMMFELFVHKTASFKNDILSGLTVALALVPEAVAFAFVAGVDPLVGLYAAFIVGLITSVIGGRPGMISGATGALAVVMVDLVATHGIEYLFATVVLMGIIQISAGILRLGKFIRLIPHPVMLGFVNGLAIIIFLAQLSQFKIKNTEGMLQWMSGSTMVLMLGLVALTMAIIHFLPKLTRAIPSSLAAILVVTGLAHGLNLDTRMVGDLASVSGGLPQFHIPTVPVTLDNILIILPYSLILAAIGLIESLMTMSLIDELTETRGRGNKECVGQGVANVVTGFFGGMGGCAMIGQSMINVNSGGRGRLSGISAALFLLIFIVFASGLIEMIPLAALVGVMFMVVIGTFAWSSFRILHKIPRTDALVLVLVSGVTVATDLAVAVCVGVIVSALVFAWESAKQITSRKSIDESGAKVYRLSGALFFGSVRSFQDQFTPKDDPDEVIIDFAEARVCDHSGLESINSLTERYLARGKKLRLTHLSPECRTLLDKAGSMIEVNVVEDPRYRVATDKLA
ncbi:MAG: SulP family inorganic anion transporter [Desulfobulbaceae bacterium]|nr:SulP family inorganic anion transporter [Desulfobulbaceae bacterium]